MQASIGCNEVQMINMRVVYILYDVQLTYTLKICDSRLMRIGLGHMTQIHSVFLLPLLLCAVNYCACLYHSTTA
jgi:hypothetical protein